MARTNMKTCGISKQGLHTIRKGSIVKIIAYYKMWPNDNIPYKARSLAGAKCYYGPQHLIPYKI